MVKLTPYIMALALAVNLLASTRPAHALPAFEARANAAIADGAYPGSGGGHAFYFSPGYESGKRVDIFGGSRFVFDDFGEFEVDASGQAELKGTIYRGIMQGDRSSVLDADASRAFEVKLKFDYRGSGAAGQGSGGPKQELPNAAYASAGGPVDTGLWDYWHLSSGTLEGVTGSAFDGLKLKLTERPAGGKFPFQSGIGANNKNAEHDGLSGWFNWEVAENSNDYKYWGYDRGGRKVKKKLKTGAIGSGDVNIEWDQRVPPDELPEPGSLLLLGAGIAALVGYGRRISHRA